MAKILIIIMLYLTYFVFPAISKITNKYKKKEILQYTFN
jgi:hypothetical protein